MQIPKYEADHSPHALKYILGYFIITVDTFHSKMD